ncbi:hypothetical protein T265_07108 [Opisthorchis viverrini]|uniref:tRNA (N(6)-L-threonylcarbamoyladenosine(37)-C(2))-methylthiotransferase n=1 Tax=Opisthorchis viverrini TaxID=6198 RepID=A0A074ZQ15_OPIVI|nr:hypothetical protein T265_07108 [Opisthorchis viverrini]KER25425.1 hypothetical protein T265_07108 [Opisthorchis viverrini]
MDIEDLHTELDVHRTEERNASVKVRFRTRRQNPADADLDSVTTMAIPEHYRVFVQTWGCAHNTSDSEYMAGLLAQYGYQVILGGSTNAKDSHGPVDAQSNNSECECSSEPADDSCQKREDKGCCTMPESLTADERAKQEADIWVLNSCTVKGPAEDHFRNAVKAGMRMGKRLVVAGCVPQSHPAADYLKGVSIIGVQQIDRVVEVVEETLQGNTVRFLDKKWAVSEDGDSHSARRRLGGARLDLPKIRRNPLIEILAVSTGCLNACTYCKTKHARGVLASYPIEELLERAKQAFADGVKELWLTSEDLGAYGRDLDRTTSVYSCPSMAVRFPQCLTLADLLSGLVRLIPEGCMLRLGMTNPPYILEQLREMADVLSHPRVYAFLHVPVQSDCLNCYWVGMTKWLEREFTDRKVRGSNSTPVFRLSLSRPVQLGSVLALVQPLGGMTVRHRMGATAERLDRRSDAVLDCMKREYTVDEFSHVVTYLQDHIPPPPLPPDATDDAVNGSGTLTVATDIICGFPNETEADFEETVKLVERFRFPVLYINQFFARPGTPAASMFRKATTAEVKKRTRRLHDIFRAYKPYEGRQGSLVRVLVTETSHDGRFWVGHTKAYEQVLVPKIPEVYGRIILVRITECDKFFMRSDIVDPGPLDSLVFQGPLHTSPTLSTLEPLVKTTCSTAIAQPVVHAVPPSSPKQENTNWVLHLGVVLLVTYIILKICEMNGYFQRVFVT